MWECAGLTGEQLALTSVEPSAVRLRGRGLPPVCAWRPRRAFPRKRVV